MNSTLFVDHLPQNVNSLELQRLFSNQGQIADAYVSHIQRSRVHGRFGFIEVKSREQGDRLILETDGMILGRQVIKVQWARYPKGSRKAKNPWQQKRFDKQTWNRDWGCNHIKRMWRPKHQTHVTSLSEEFVPTSKAVKVLQLEQVNDNLEWLEKSMTCISDTPRDVEELRTTIQSSFPHPILVRDIGKFKFLLTAETKEIKDKLRTEGADCLNQWFSSISEWVEEDVCQTRRLWLEIVGVPLQVWNEENIKKIAENWGDVVYVEKDISAMASFAFAKVVIDSLCMEPIEDEALLQVGDKGFRVSVFEAKTKFIIIHAGPLDEESSASSMKFKCSQKVAELGCSCEVEAKGDLAHEDWRKG